MSKNLFIASIAAAAGLLVLSVLAAHVAVDVHNKKHPSNFRNIPWDISPAALSARLKSRRLAARPAPSADLEEKLRLGRYDALVVYGFDDGRLRRIRIEAPGAPVEACDYFLVMLDRRFGSPAASGGEGSDFAARLAGAPAPASKKGPAYWAAWHTEATALRLQCGGGAGEAGASVTFQPLPREDYGAQKEL